MDSVRFGRALGFGTRAAAKTLVKAVDAATSPNPSAGVAAKQGSGGVSAVASSDGKADGSGRADGSGSRLGQHVTQTTSQVLRTGKELKKGSKQFGKVVGGRLATLSSTGMARFSPSADSAKAAMLRAGGQLSCSTAILSAVTAFWRASSL